jgi:hypothetical protein
MPNPLLKLGNGANRGQRAPDRPQPVQPVPEHYAGSNHPYRGIEDHGVTDTVKPDDDMSYDGARDAFFEIEPPAPDVVPVRIVQQDGQRSRRKCRTRQVPFNVDDPPTQILSRNDRRISARIRCVTPLTQDLWVVAPTRETCTLQNGYINQATSFTEFTTVAQDELYIAVPGGQGGSASGAIVRNVYVYEEFEQDV